MAETEYNLTVGSMAAVNRANRTSNLVEACVRMFDKLRGSTKFFQNLLKTFGVTAEELGNDIVGKIEAMKLDMNNSVGEAQIILTEVKGKLIFNSAISSVLKRVACNLDTGF
uniref:PMEI domain-containing protein n=1 Tax=Globodera pallida TaxID=36090 RepID=A0A183CQD5_GLOPA